MGTTDDILLRLAQTAADLGPAIEPPGATELLQSVAQTAHELTGAAACSIAILDRETEELHFVAATGPGADAILGLRMDAHKGIAGWALASGQSISVGEVAQDPRFARDVAEATGYLPNTIFAIPLETDQGSVGVLEILDADATKRAAAGVADEREVSEVIAILAQHAALTIGTMHTFQDLGRVLFSAAARAAAATEAAGDGAEPDLQEALARAAAAAEGPSKQLAQLLAVFAELNELGPDERQTAAKILYDFLSYARGERAGS